MTAAPLILAATLIVVPLLAGKFMRGTAEQDGTTEEPCMCHLLDSSTGRCRHCGRQITARPHGFLKATLIVTAIALVALLLAGARIATW